MAVSSSLALIIISVFLSILPGHAVRDLPKSNNINISDINLSFGGFVVVATLYPSSDEASWKTNCLKQNNASLTFDEAKTYATVSIQASDATSLYCSDFYAVQLGTIIISQFTMPAPGAALQISFTFPGFEADIEKCGIAILLSTSYKLEAYHQKKENVFNIVKEVALETF